MKYTCILLAIGLFVCSNAQTPVFLSGQYVNAGGSPIDVEYYGSPYFYDWDGDGIKDLLAGQFYYGRVRFYKNIGTNQDPEFNTFQFLEADGSYIEVTYG